MSSPISDLSGCLLKSRLFQSDKRSIASGWPVVLALLSLAVSEGQAASGQDTNGDNHLITVIRRRVESTTKPELVMFTLPKAGAADQQIKRQLLAGDKFSSYGFRPLGVRGGHLLMLKSYNLIALDLKSNAERVIHKGIGDTPVKLVGDRVFSMVYAKSKTGGQARKWIEIDLQTLKARDLYQVDWWFGDRSRIAVAPDLSRIAVTEFIRAKPQATPHATQVVIIDLKTGKSTTIKQAFASSMFLTGGGHHHIGPAISWLNPKTLLVATSKVKNKKADQQNVVEFNGGGGPMEVWSVDAISNQSTLVCDLPLWQRKMHEPVFSKGTEESQLITLGKLGNYRIDTKTKRVIEDNRIAANYELRGPRDVAELWHKEQKLAAKTGFDRVFVSPLGSAAWVTAETIRGGTIIRNYDSTLSVFSPSHKKIQVVGKGWFETISSGFPQPRRPVCIWVSDEQLQRSKIIAELPVLAPPRRVYTDTRPKVVEFAKVEMRLDKPKYREHEAVKVSIKVENLLDTPIKFPTPSVGRWGRPIRLNLASPRSRSLVDEFDKGWPESPSGHVEIPPKAVRIYTRAIEVFEPGKHSLELQFQHNIWNGRITQKIDFEVVVSPAQESLFKLKFDRLMAMCRAEFDVEPNSCQASRLWDLKAGAAPLLVKFFKEHPDEIAFRQRMGRALTGVADASTLPYFEELLAGDLEHDGNMVVDACMSLFSRSSYYRKPVHQAVDLLVVAGSHKNVEVRRRTISHLRTMTDSRVDRLMLKAAEDPDPGIATMAARYVAARENRTLSEWFANANKQLTAARLVAARSIVKDLKKTFGKDRGEIPAGSFNELMADAAKMKIVKKTLANWTNWATENDRFSKQFFDKDRALAKKVIGRVDTQ